MNPLPNALIRPELVFFAEAFIFIAAWAVCLARPQATGRAWERFIKVVGELARHPVLSTVLVGLIAFWGSALVCLLVRFPEPGLHDEFSYIVAADTFAEGRLANPTHPMWKHFETFHVLQQTSYASKYPPAQGLVLALGQVVGGHPVVGVWLGIAFACMAIHWMLRAWTTDEWALIGGVLAALHLGCFGYWAQNYWGGGVAAGGGALLLGAVRRAKECPRIWPGVLMGLALFLLANSRPLEGLVFSLCAVPLLLTWLRREERPLLGRRLLKVGLPLLAVLLIATAWTGYYNYRVTGNPVKFPHQAYGEAYAFMPVFLWQEAQPVPERCREVFKVQQEEWRSRVEVMRTLGGYIQVKGWEFLHMVLLLLGFGSIVALVGLFRVRGDAWVHYAWLVVGVITVLVMAERMTMARKLAPMSGLVFFLVTRGLMGWAARRSEGSSKGVAVLFAVMLAATGAVAASFHPVFHAPQWPPAAQRTAIIKDLKSQGGRHLILVRYSPEHWPHFEWVYNRADIDNADVVWARELDPVSNRELVDYFKDRKVWLVLADMWVVSPVEPLPYPRHELALPKRKQ